MAGEEDLAEEVITFWGYLTERQEKKTVAIYPGRFQPMGPHHFQTYKQIAADHGVDATYVATSDKTGPKSPLNFVKKRSIMLKHGVPESQIQQVTNPYYAKEIYEQLEFTRRNRGCLFCGYKRYERQSAFSKDQRYYERGV